MVMAVLFALLVGKATNNIFESPLEYNMACPGTGILDNCKIGRPNAGLR